MKFCTRCMTNRPLSDFHKNSRNKDGLQINCKPCRKVIDKISYEKNEYRRKSIKDRRIRIKSDNQIFMRRYKRFCGCHFCNEREPIALDLHHTDPEEKDMNPSNAISYSREYLKQEIRKCVVLCANCHRKVHAGILEIKF